MELRKPDYLPPLTALMPRGVGFRPDKGDIREILVRTARYLNETDSRLRIIWTESNPYTTLQLLPEWEESFGLPNECYVPGTQTLDERKQAVISKWEDTGGDRIARYLLLAQTLGYPDATITRFRYHTCEMDCETPINEITWRFVWRLNVQKASTVKESTCMSGVNDPLRVWGDGILECMISRDAADFVVVLYGYLGEDAI